MGQKIQVKATFSQAVITNIRTFPHVIQKCSEQLHDEKLWTVAFDIMYVKPFIRVVGK